MHMLFGLGGAVVIIGALFKILHLEIGPITGGLVLGLGLGTEALIFTVSALNTGEIKEEHDDFVKKVKGGGGKAASAEEPGLSSKIDEMLREAKLDVALINNLTRSIKNLEASAQALSPAADAASSSEAYSQQLATASQKLEQLNQVYAEQVNSAGNNAAFNEKVAENADKLKQQMEALSSNLAALNQVYKGMLSAMNKN
ncbi:MAG: gliding motility protein GldL [Flavobacteriia bacterium]|nr:gliding motility protein GldL [Flavobacteriia bacterium]